MFKYKGVNLKKSVYRPYAPLISTLFFTGMGRQSSWEKFIGLRYALKDVLCVDGTYYYPEYHLVSFPKRATQHLFSRRKNFLYLKKETERREKLILSANQAKNFKDFFAPYLEYMPTLAIYHICDDLIEARLRKELGLKLPQLEVDRLMHFINLPAKMTEEQKMRRWFKRTGDVAGFIKKYSWNFSRYGEHRYLSVAEARKFLKELKKEKAASPQSQGELRRELNRARKILGSHGYFVDLMQFFVYYRTHRTDMINKVFFGHYNKFLTLAKKLGLDYQEFLHCSAAELSSGNIPNKKELLARQEAVAVVLSHGKLRVVSGPEVKELRLICGEDLKSSKITGKTAFPGKAVGIVRVVRDRQDFELVSSGDILVAPMTTPSMVPIMKKAAAFVTDEGGITCHAAILAREMKKPCIIGTGRATSVLQSGDRVEVDAGKGEVRIF